MANETKILSISVLGRMSPKPMVVIVMLDQ